MFPLHTHRDFAQGSDGTDFPTMAQAERRTGNLFWDLFDSQAHVLVVKLDKTPPPPPQKGAEGEREGSRVGKGGRGEAGETQPAAQDLSRVLKTRASQQQPQTQKVPL